MEDIKNYRLKDFIKQDEVLIHDYMGVLEFLKPIQTKYEIFYLKLREVQDIRDLLNEGKVKSLIKILTITQGLTDKQVRELEILEFFPLIASVKEQIKNIARAEELKLTSKQANFKMEAVNYGEKMAVFGIYNVLDRLSGGDITKYEEILEIKYADVFTKLAMETLKGDLQTEMDNIKIS